MHAPSTLVLGLTLYALVVWVLAFLRGGLPERLGAGIIMTNQALTMALSYFGGRILQTTGGFVAQLTLDGITGFALMALVMLFGRAWLGFAMLLYAAQFTLHSVYFVVDLPKDRLHAVLNNLNFLAIHTSLAVGAVQYWVANGRAMRSARLATG